MRLIVLRCGAKGKEQAAQAAPAPPRTRSTSKAARAAKRGERKVTVVAMFAAQQTLTALGGDYRDAIRNRKAKVLLLGHENSGGMSAFTAKQLYCLGHEAKEHGNDSTDYQRSHTARSFVPFYAQRMCTATVMHGARGILKGLKIARAARLRRAGTASDSDCSALGVQSINAVGLSQALLYHHSPPP